MIGQFLTAYDSRKIGLNERQSRQRRYRCHW